MISQSVSEIHDFHHPTTPWKLSLFYCPRCFVEVHRLPPNTTLSAASAQSENWSQVAKNFAAKKGAKTSDSPNFRRQKIAEKTQKISSSQVQKVSEKVQKDIFWSPPPQSCSCFLSCFFGFFCDCTKNSSMLTLIKWTNRILQFYPWHFTIQNIWPQKWPKIKSIKVSNVPGRPEIPTVPLIRPWWFFSALSALLFGFFCFLWKNGRCFPRLIVQH